MTSVPVIVDGEARHACRKWDGPVKVFRSPKGFGKGPR
jgi:hypothetical protein